MLVFKAIQVKHIASFLMFLESVVEFVLYNLVYHSYICNTCDLLQCYNSLCFMHLIVCWTYWRLFPMVLLRHTCTLEIKEWILSYEHMRTNHIKKNNLLLLLRSMWWLSWLDPLSRECCTLGCPELILCRPTELGFEGHTSGPYLLPCLLVEWAGL